MKKHMICSLGTDMEKGSALYFEAGNQLVDALKEGAILKAQMIDYNDDREWNEEWQLKGGSFLSDSGTVFGDLVELIAHLDQNAGVIEVYMNGELIGSVSDLS